jgi:hypothetical protein
MRRPVIGPVVSEVQFNKIQGLIQAGIDEGAKLVVGGTGRPEGWSTGYFVKPTVFSEVNNDMTIAREEIFGPVLAMIPYDTEEEAIAMANDTPYGLAGYVQSGDIEHARRWPAHPRRQPASQRRLRRLRRALRRLQAVRQRTRVGRARLYGLPRNQGAGGLRGLMADYILAIDQGTTGSTVALVDAQGQLCASVNVEFPSTSRSRAGWSTRPRRSGPR